MIFKILPDFFDNPPKIKYVQQEADEHIELLLRQHKITTLPWIITALLAVVFPLFLPVMDAQFFKVLPQIPGDIILITIILWYMLVMAYTLEKFLYWYFNIYIVTNLHLIDVTMSSLLSKTTTEVFFEDVQSARTKMSGIFGSLFNFGDVIIQTAADKQEIKFSSVPYPDMVAERIQDLREETVLEGGHDVP